jgi:hypothetical protein
MCRVDFAESVIRLSIDAERSNTVDYARNPPNERRAASGYSSTTV